MGKQEVCFGDCLNLNFENGPYLNQLGKVPEDAVPKKFIWGYSLWWRNNFIDKIVFKHLKIHKLKSLTLFTFHVFNFNFLIKSEKQKGL